MDASFWLDLAFRLPLIVPCQATSAHRERRCTNASYSLVPVFRLLVIVPCKATSVHRERRYLTVRQTYEAFVPRKVQPSFEVRTSVLHRTLSQEVCMTFA